MKKFSFFVGIDVSKETLDVCVLKSEKMEVLSLSVVTNTQKGIKRIISGLKSLIIDCSDTLFCFENTGIYSMPLSVFFSGAMLNYWEIPALEIKKAKGITRGKSDKTDARDIALYSVRNIDKLLLSSVAEVDIQQLKLLFSEREKLVKSIKLFESTQEGKAFIPGSIYKVIATSNRKTVAFLKNSLKAIDGKIKSIREQNERLNAQYQLLKSVPGIGDITALYMIVTTRGFERFENWRKFACYSGIAPFQYTSGSSIRGKTRVNHLADKKMKSLLNMAALSAVRHDQEIKEYYERKIHEGKNPMLVLNNIRCKIVGRAFAVINRSTPFVNFKKYAA
jgi:transposase